jgi:flagellar basal-body rod protein FlgC
MGLFTSINIAATGMSAERLRSDVISDNIANASTTRTQDGGPFKRSRVVLGQRNSGVDWRTPSSPRARDRCPGTGVKVVGVEKDNAEARLGLRPDPPRRDQVGPEGR